MHWEIVDEAGGSVQVEAIDWTMAMVRFVEAHGIEVSAWVCDTATDGSVRISDVASGSAWVITKVDAPPPTAPTSAPTSPPTLPPGLMGATAAPVTPPQAPTLPASKVVLPKTPEEMAEEHEPGVTLEPVAPALDPPDEPSSPFTPAEPPPRQVLDEQRKPSVTPEAKKQQPKLLSNNFDTAPEHTEEAGEDELPPPVLAPPPGEEDDESEPVRSRAPLMEPRQKNYKVRKRNLWRPGSTHRDGAVPRKVASKAPSNLAERLFDLSTELAACDRANEACLKALNLSMALVPCEAGSVVRGGINDPALKFVATAGPAAQDMLGAELQYGEGLLGVAFDLGITVVVNNAYADPRFNRQFDELTGFHTRSVLCVAVRGKHEFYGAIELINPPDDRFLPWQIEVAETIANTLSEVLAGHVG